MRSCIKYELGSLVSQLYDCPNKRPYDSARTPSNPALAEIQSSPRTGSILWRVSGNQAERKAIAGICKEAMAIEVSGPQRNRALQKRMKQTLGVPEEQTIQMLFRWGYAGATPHPPRRDVTALIRRPARQRKRVGWRFQSDRVEP